jgi:50S ribosome-binding GTPase
MPTYQSFAAEVRRLDRAIRALEPQAAAAGVAPPAGQEWFDLLKNKLLAQLDMPPLLVAAIVGGTNIGKSSIFNHLAGEVASAASPLAAGTKHPVCLVPSALADPTLLARLFEPFQLHAWQSADDPLADSSEDRLFWRVGQTMPPRLLLLDAPDVDSDATVNWHRARAIRQAADVLVAVLTQQKYNDAAVKQFFRAAVEADKPIIVVFNQCELDADRVYWPQWLETFCQQTGATPESAYVVPYDRRAAEELRLPFYKIESQVSPLPTNLRSAPGEGTGVRAGEGSAVGVQGSGSLSHPSSFISHPSSFISHPSSFISHPSSTSPHPSPLPKGEGTGLRENALRADLASLRFDAIKIRTFRGALGRVLDPQHGAPAYLDSIRRAAGEFSAAAKALSATEMARVGWPALPAGVLVDEMRDWWDASRQEWSRRIHGFYRVLGRGVTWPVRAAWDAVAGPQSDPLAVFQRQERAAIIMAVEKLLDELDRLAQVGNDTLRPRLMRLLGGRARATLLDRVQAAHESLPAVDEHYRAFLRGELDAWRDASPRAVRFLQSLDHAAAVARPVITVALFFTGLHFAGDLAGQVAANAAGATAGHLATEAAITGGIAGGGEALVSTTSEGVRQAAGRLFGRLQSRYTQQRARWLAEWLERELLGDLLADLRRGAEVPEGKEFQEVEAIIATLATNAGE